LLRIPGKEFPGKAFSFEPGKHSQRAGDDNMAQALMPQELKAMLEGPEKPVLVDVRRKLDYETAPKRIGSAEWRDPEKIDEWSHEIPRDQPVVVYCVKGGSVSQSVADRLQQGHSGVRYLQGGIKAWAELGEPVE
jgi:rhodanese-related sulfurtransferase